MRAHAIHNTPSKNFVQDPFYRNSKVINYGRITAGDRGLVALVAPGVENHGVITAKLGKVALGAGSQYTIDLYGDSLINFAVGGKKIDPKITNTGAIYADGGYVQITAAGASGVVSNAINMKGIVQANRVYQKGGTIVLSAGSGKVRVSGKLHAKGGKVKVLGIFIHRQITFARDFKKSAIATISAPTRRTHSGKCRYIIRPHDHATTIAPIVGIGK